MIPPRRLNPTALVTVAVAAASLGAGTAVATGASSPPARDTFTGQVTASAGRYASVRDRLTVYLLPQSTGSRRRIIVQIVGRGCSAATIHCVRLHGTLTGTMTAQKTVPDLPTRFALIARGRVRPLGRVSATGVVQGIGFVISGRETLTLTLRNAHGRVALAGHSAVLRGFTSP